MKVEPQKEHAWLQKLLGDWTAKGEAVMEPGQPPQQWETTEHVRSIGDVWVQCEGEGEMPDGDPATTVMTLGYDTQKKQFVGTFIGSMMTNLWVYEGSLDADGRTLTLSAEGPDFGNEGKYAQYRDVIAFENDDHRTLTSYMLDADGKWNPFMTAHYRRKR
ncbi:hypothetical protein BGLT_05537 [Caballeronia glathei]|jgi:hypothetical protein|uniref:DUF1579 domain-containing protein n=1 Tax=Caballeronia glathei TaxID=60547 RepID=A0A069PPK2_9BURK|nr:MULTISPECIES: DUF1579 domain-containing protein [Burkholderiaceae]KDR41804.1 hypothetical protein BG61_15015 [Caballeronia glathei]TCK43302.1 uncharacterized protein DUF1579 [Paraburkholderia sp. BL8N3]CDY76458.1 hypothetical protein BGLT_05537 [Caballeronia glathei]